MSLKDTCVLAWESLSVSLASGEALTAKINLGGLRLFGLIVPSSWTTADLTFQVSPDAGATWFDLRAQDGTEVVVGGKSGSCMALEPATFAGFQYIRVRSGTTSAAVAQTADRAIQLIVRGV